MDASLLPGRRRDIVLLIFSIAGILLLAGRGLFVLVSGFLPVPGLMKNDWTASLLSGLSLFFCAGLLLPLLVSSIRKLRGQEIKPSRVSPIQPAQLAEVAGIWALMLILASILPNLIQFGNLLAIPAFLLGIAIPIAVLAWIAIGGLPAGSIRRLWAAFGIGMAGSTLVALVLEFLLAGMGVLAAGIVAFLDPQIRVVLQQIMNQVASGGDIETLLTTLAPYLTNPLVLLLALLFAAVMAPIIEESLKPLAVWLLGKRLRSPAEGFALGALCGAGFAMLEGMQAAGGMSQMLGIGIAARAASSLMHITASGMLGWGIASARLEKRYGRLAGAYLFSISLHGLWNASVVLAIFGALRLSLPGGGADLPGTLLVGAGIGLLVLMLVVIAVLLPMLNRRLRRVPMALPKPPQSDIIAPLHP